MIESSSSLADEAAERRRPAPFERVFVATDFSAGAARAIARAGRLPLVDGGTISVVHVLPERLPEKMLASAESLAHRQLEPVIASLFKATSTLRRRKVRIEPQVLRGPAHVEIVRHARAAGAELIVLGRHGQQTVREMFLGSTVERVIRTGDLPVLVVSLMSRRAYRRPLFAVDLSDACRAVVTLGLRVVGPSVGDATLVHAYHVPFEGFITPAVSPGEMTDLRKEYRQTAASEVLKLRSSLGDLGVRLQTVLVRGDARTAILTVTVRMRTDLLAVGTHGRSGLSHALIGSVAESLIRAATCDVLVARPARVSFELP